MNSIQDNLMGTAEVKPENSVCRCMRCRDQYLYITKGKLTKLRCNSCGTLDLGAFIKISEIICQNCSSGQLKVFLIEIGGTDICVSDSTCPNYDN